MSEHHNVACPWRNFCLLIKLSKFHESSARVQHRMLATSPFGVVADIWFVVRFVNVVLQVMPFWTRVQHRMLATSPFGVVADIWFVDVVLRVMPFWTFSVGGCWLLCATGTPASAVLAGMPVNVCIVCVRVMIVRAFRLQPSPARKCPRRRSWTTTLRSTWWCRNSTCTRRRRWVWTCVVAVGGGLMRAAD